MSVEELAGVKSSGTLMFAFLGSALTLSWMPPASPTQRLIALATGFLVAVAAAPMTLRYFELPDTAERGVAFFVALVAMRAIPPLLDVMVENIRAIRFPWNKG